MQFRLNGLRLLRCGKEAKHMSVFTDQLKEQGWIEASPAGAYTKGHWRITFDTSSWIILEVRTNFRVFDVHVPGDDESGWTVNLIEHLCQLEDERHRLRQVLERILAESAPDAAVALVARQALEQCYHQWRINTHLPKGEIGRRYCSICGKQISGNE